MSNKRAKERKKRRDAERAAAKAEAERKLQEEAERRQNEKLSRQRLLGPNIQHYDDMLWAATDWKPYISGPVIIGIAIKMHLEGMNASIYAESRSGEKDFLIDEPGQNDPPWKELRVSERLVTMYKNGTLRLDIPVTLISHVVTEQISDDAFLNSMKYWHRANKRALTKIRQIRADLALGFCERRD